MAEVKNRNFEQKQLKFICFLRIGFCGEAHPRFILSTEIESITDILKKTDTSLYDQTAAFLTKIFFK